MDAMVRRMVDLAAGLEYEHLPEAAVHAAKARLIDSMGVAIGCPGRASGARGEPDRAADRGAIPGPAARHRNRDDSRHGRVRQRDHGPVPGFQRCVPHPGRVASLGQPARRPRHDGGPRRGRARVHPGACHLLRDPVPLHRRRAVQRCRLGSAGRRFHGMRAGVRAVARSRARAARRSGGARVRAVPVHLPDAGGGALDVEGLRRPQRGAQRHLRGDCSPPRASPVRTIPSRACSASGTRPPGSHSS